MVLGSHLGDSSLDTVSDGHYRVQGLDHSLYRDAILRVPRQVQYSEPYDQCHELHQQTVFGRFLARGAPSATTQIVLRTSKACSTYFDLDRFE